MCEQPKTDREEGIERRMGNAPAHVQVAFWEMVADGQSHTMAEMFAWHQCALYTNSDRTFNEGSRRTMEEKMGGAQMKAYLAMARRAGINTQGKFYKGGLGRPTDPMAWVSTADDVLEVCKAKKLNCDGVVKHTAPEPEPRKKVRMAKDIVNRYVARELANPETAAKVREGSIKPRDLEEKVVAKHSKKG